MRCPFLRGEEDGTDSLDAFELLRGRGGEEEGEKTGGWIGGGGIEAGGRSGTPSMEMREEG